MGFLLKIINKFTKDYIVIYREKIEWVSSGLSLGEVLGVEIQEDFSKQQTFSSLILGSGWGGEDRI